MFLVGKIMNSGITTKPIEAIDPWFFQGNFNLSSEPAGREKKFAGLQSSEKEVPASITLLPGTEKVCAFSLLGGGRSPR